MIDIKFLRENPEAVKENIRKKFQDEKLPLVEKPRKRRTICGPAAIRSPRRSAH